MIITAWDLLPLNWQDHQCASHTLFRTPYDWRNCSYSIICSPGLTGYGHWVVQLSTTSLSLAHKLNSWLQILVCLERFWEWGAQIFLFRRLGKPRYDPSLLSWHWCLRDPQWEIAWQGWDLFELLVTQVHFPSSSHSYMHIHDCWYQMLFAWKT